MKEGGGGGRCDGAKTQQKNNFGPPWKNCDKLKGGGGVVGRWACSRTTTGRERKSGWAIGMLGRGRVTPRWADEPVRWLWRALENMEGLGSIHKNKRQILGFEQSLTEAWKKKPHNLVTLFDPGDRLTHTINHSALVLSSQSASSITARFACYVHYLA